MIIGDILLIVEGIIIAFMLNPYSILISEVNILFKFLYFLCFIFGMIMLIVGIRELKRDIHNYISAKKEHK